MPEYIEFPIETNPEVLAQEAFDYVQAKFPGWLPNDANLETIMVEVGARLAAEARDVASIVPVDIFRYFGGLVGIDPIQATPASATTTWTMLNNAGYTIPGGTQVGLRAAGDVLIPFQTMADVVVPPGQTQATNVNIQAVEPGDEASGLGGVGVAMELISTIDFVTSVTLAGVTTGGVDAEEEEEYLGRLRSRLQLLAPRPILARDFAIMAEDIAGVDRAVALDGYNPADQTSNNERMVAVAAVDELGEAISGPLKTEVQTYLDEHREVNFVVNMLDPTYTAVDVTFNAVAHLGYDPASVEAAAEAAVSSYLSPANWGLVDSSLGDAAQSESWVNVKVVRYLELAQIINDVAGINYITSLTLRIGANAYASADVNLPGAVPLPRPGVINGTVSAP